MMRKLTKLATAAIAALALLAVAAAPASADRAFQIIDSNGIPCDAFSPAYCEDTGYEGTFILGTSYPGGATCTASFDIRIEVDGALETYNTDVDCDGQLMNNVAWECNDTWTGQLRLPDTGPAQIDLTGCLSYYPHGSYTHNITVNVRHNPRRWEQVGTGTTNAPVPISNGYFQDYYTPDNISANIL